MNPSQRIAITGMGAISPLGVGCRDTFDKLVAGNSGIDHITQFDASRQLVQIAGEVKDFNPSDHMERKLARRCGRFAQFAVAASREAIAQANLDLSREDPNRVGTFIASAIGDFPMLEEQMGVFLEQGPGKMNPFTVPRVSSSMGAGMVAMIFGLTGPSFGVSSACATGAHAVATASLILKAGLADVVLAGGTESAITPAFVESYIALRGLSRRNHDPGCASRPFDRDRDGFVLGEGGAVLVLETLAHAQARGATILAELIGIGMTSDAFHITAPHPDGRGAADAMKMALQSAGLQPGQVDYINAHGTATTLNDPIETKAIKSVFGERAYEIPVSSIKSMIGHCIAGAGALEAVISVMAIDEGTIPPTINLDHPDPECDLDYVPHVARKKKPDVVMSNSFGFGGQNCVLIFRRFDQS